MKIDLKGFHRNCKDDLMGGLIIHKGRCMTESETRILVNYGISKGYKLADEIPEEIVDEICDTHGNAEWMREYDDTPIFVSLPTLKRAINNLNSLWFDNSDELYSAIIEELGYEEERDYSENDD